MKQEIKEIKIAELNLWTENPRDPIKSEIGDLEIIKRAIKNEGDKWNLPKLIEKMGNYYHFNKLPIVVEENNKLIVYDGNCRIAILKYLQNPSWSLDIEGTLFPKHEPKDLKNLNKIPCAVCDRATALDIIYRDNISNNTWSPLTQAYFEHYLLEKDKSLFLEFEEITALISKHDKLNQRFVKDEVITEKNLESIGFKIEDKKLYFSGNKNDAGKVLESLISLIEDGKIKTRDDEKKGTIRVKKGGLGKAIEKLLPDSTKIINHFDETKKQVFTQNELSTVDNNLTTSRVTQRTKKELLIPFGSKLILKKCEVSDIYRDFSDLYDYYLKNKDDLSKNFPAIFRVIIRLLVESAAGGFGNLDKYVKENFLKGKANLSKDDTNTLFNNDVNGEGKLIALLQNGGHNYSASSNIDQTIAMSLIIGAMLKITHSKK